MAGFGGATFAAAGGGGGWTAGAGAAGAGAARGGNGMVAGVDAVGGMTWGTGGIGSGRAAGIGVGAGMGASMPGVGACQAFGTGMVFRYSHSRGMPPAARATMISGSARMEVGGGVMTGGRGFAGAEGGAAPISAAAVLGSAGKWAPQPAQTVALTLSTLPQTGQGLRSSGTPQAAQKRSPGGLLCWQLGQWESSIDAE